MDSKKYIGMDVYKESISIAVMNGAGKIVMECVIETKASMILQFIDGLRGDLQVYFDFGTVLIPRTVGFRFRYLGQGSGIPNGMSDPQNFTWCAVQVPC
jgi:hypothetical protein